MSLGKVLGWSLTLSFKEYTMSYEMSYTCEDDTEVTVTFKMVGSHMKGRTEYGRALEPDEYPEVEIESIKDSDDQDVKVSEKDSDKINELAYEYAEEAAQEAKYESKIDAYEEARYGY